jgi:hypothetical protein
MGEAVELFYNVQMKLAKFYAVWVIGFFAKLDVVELALTKLFLSIDQY